MSWVGSYACNFRYADAPQHVRVEGFIAAARRLIGMRYVPQQTGEFGYIDCIHVIVRALKTIRYLPEEFTCPLSPPTADPSLWIQMGDYLNEVSVAEMAHGDVVIVYEHLSSRATQAPQPRHCGIVTQNEGHPERWNWLGVSYLDSDPFVRETVFNGKARERIWKVYRLR